MISLEVLHEKTLPSHPVQHWKYILASFVNATDPNQPEASEEEVVCLNLPDEACEPPVASISLLDGSPHLTRSQ